MAEHNRCHSFKRIICYSPDNAIRCTGLPAGGSCETPSGEMFRSQTEDIGRLIQAPVKPGA
jgi:hypothetical protein